MQKERRDTNLTNRLSTYNKSDQHRVVYNKQHGVDHLQEYREQANRERFILPENEEISLFTSCINL
jgi:hypothetical protein